MIKNVSVSYFVWHTHPNERLECLRLFILPTIQSKTCDSVSLLKLHRYGFVSLSSPPKWITEAVHLPERANRCRFSIPLSTRQLIVSTYRLWKRRLLSDFTGFSYNQKSNESWTTTPIIRIIFFLKILIFICIHITYFMSCQLCVCVYVCESKIKFFCTTSNWRKCGLSLIPFK